MKYLVTTIAVILIAAAGYLYLGTSSKGPGDAQEYGSSKVPETNVTVENGLQIVVIHAKGGYAPRQSTAKAGVPTVIRFDTNGTYDCSVAVRIPSLGVSKFLPPNGETDVDIGTPAAGTLAGTCGMGMYRFAITFQS